MLRRFALLLTIALVFGYVCQSTGEIIFQPWTHTETDQFHVGRGAWSDNTLNLIYTPTSEDNAGFGTLEGFLPANAIGIQFDVSSTLTISQAYFHIQAYSSLSGAPPDKDFVLEQRIGNDFTADGAVRYGDLTDWSIVITVPAGPQFDAFPEMTNNGITSITLFFTEEILRENFYRIFFHASGRQDPVQYLGGTTTFSNVGWLLVDPSDSDDDGIPDDEDNCPDSDLNPMVVIDSCGSGVENTLLDGGCTIADLILEIAESAENHAEFVSGVAELTNDLRRAGIITEKEKGAIQRCAAQADIP